MEISDPFKVIPSVVSDLVVGEESYVGTSTVCVSALSSIRMIAHLRPSNYRNDEDTHDHGTLDLVHHQVGSDDTSTHESYPELEHKT